MGESVLSPKKAPVSVIERAALFEDAGLERREGSLWLGGVRLTEIAQQVGTPAYIYNADAIRSQYRRLDSALAAIPHRICYAVKANSNLAVLRVLRDLGAGADIVSGGEMQRALAAGFAADAIVFSGVGKSAPELEAALAAGVGHIHLESADELHIVSAVANEGPTLKRGRPRAQGRYFAILKRTSHITIAVADREES